MVTGKLLVIIQILLSHKVFGAQIDSVCTCASAGLHVQVGCNLVEGHGFMSSDEWLRKDCLQGCRIRGNGDRQQITCHYSQLLGLFEVMQATWFGVRMRWVSILHLTCTSCVALGQSPNLGKSFNFSKSEPLPLL